MNYKIKGAIERNRKKFILCLILWFILTIVFVSPISYSIFLAKASGQFDINIFIESITTSMINPIKTIGDIFSNNAIGEFINTLVVVTIIYLILYVIGFFKSMPKNEFTDIEHGSSDWSQHGEQYRVLNNKKGLILAQNNYLPLDKRGNVNVLVVGRIRFW